MPPIKHVFRWDLDKTYLRTEFDSWRGLLRSALESAGDKQAYPGATALLRALRQEPGHRICIVSGSPTQMRRVLTAKLALDGVEHDEFVLKDNLRNLARGRFRALRSQVPYKLPTLLASRSALAGTPDETLLGDDAEADAIIYCLYADLLAGRVPIDELERILSAARAYDDEIERTLALARGITRPSGGGRAGGEQPAGVGKTSPSGGGRAGGERPAGGGNPPADSVRRILIHLDRRSPTARFAQYGPRLVPIYNYFQAAVILYADGVLSARQLLFVALDMLDSSEYELSTLANSLQDLVRRGRLDLEVARRLAQEAREAAEGGALAGRADLPPFDRVADAFVHRLRGLGDLPPLEHPTAAPALDYVSLVDREHQERRERKRARRR